MDADFEVELGADDATLEFPWEAAGSDLRHWDIKRNPELFKLIEEAQQYGELGGFLTVVNSTGSMLETAKCDVWVETQLSEAEEIYDANLKLMSYIDLVFEADETETSGPRFEFAAHEKFVRRLVELLGRAPQISAAAEFMIRRCFYRGGGDEVTEGFYVTFYLSGYGEDPADARRRWGIGLIVVQNALLQLSAEFRKAPTIH